MLRRRFSRALAVTAIASLVMATAALADTVVVSNTVLLDGDSVAGSPGGSGTVLIWSDTTNGVPAGDTNGCNSTGAAPLTVKLASSHSGVTTAAPGSVSLGACGSSAAASLSYSIAADACVANVGDVVSISIDSVSGGRTDGTRLYETSDILNITGLPACALVNTAPTLSWTAGPIEVDESGTTEHTYSFSIADPDADTWSFGTAGDPSCGVGGSLVAGSASISQIAKSGTFKCTFPDGIYPLTSSISTVSVAVSDGTDVSEALTRDVTISNVAPSVDVPAWQSASVDCRQSATLTSIGFRDPGINDDPWALSVDFDSDGNADYTDAQVASQGTYGNQSVTFNTPGSYTATVDVTDKDGDTGSSSTATPLTVNQVYNVTSFYSPLDTSTNIASVKNSFKNGRVVPVKVSLQDGCTLAAIDGNSGITPTVKLVKVSLTPGGTDAIEEFADAGQSSDGTNAMRWSATDNFWIYNVDSKALGLATGNAYRLDIYVDGVLATHTKWVVLAPTK